jgi:outer membrane immunogenic protein
MPVAVFTWTGFYVGGNVGAEWSNGAMSIVSVPTFANTRLGAFGISELNNATAGGTGVLSSGSRAAFIGGGQIGYNYQVRNYLVSIEADIQGLDRNSSTVSTVNSLPTTLSGVNSVSTLTAQKSVDYLGTVRGRFGGLGPTVLLRATRFAGLRSS